MLHHAMGWACFHEVQLPHSKPSCAMQTQKPQKAVLTACPVIMIAHKVAKKKLF